MRRKTKKLLIILISCLLILTIGLTSYFMIFSTQWGFNLFAGAVKDYVSGEERIIPEKGDFSYETYTKEEFSEKYLGTTYESDDQLKEGLAEKYPGICLTNRTFIQVYEINKTEKEEETSKKFCINILTDFVYVTNRKAQAKE